MAESSSRLRPCLAPRQYGVVLALFLLSMITYIDRTAISTAKEPIASQLGLSDGKMGIIFGAFALGYAAMQIPAGWLADSVGPRLALAVSVGLWSVMTALTGLAWNLQSLLAIRFVFGAGEAAVFPSSARVIRNWLPPEQRGRANGALFAGSRLGAAFSYPLLAWMLALWNWRFAFLFLGLGGLMWTSAWLLWFRDRPGKPSKGAAQDFVAWEEATAPEKLAKVPLVLAMSQYFASNFTNFICLSWMLPYLRAQYNLSMANAALYSMTPLLLGATSQGLAGSLIDRLYISRLRLSSRQIPAITGFILAAAGLAAVTQVHTVGFAVIAFSVAIFGADMTVSPSWVFCTDTAGTRTGRVSGAMNMCGSLGALASAGAFPFLHQKTGASSAYFSLAAVLDVAGILCWLGMRSVNPGLLTQGAPLPEVS